MPRGSTIAIHTLATRRRSTAPGSQERADLTYLLALGRRFIDAPLDDARRATIARALRVNAWWYETRDSPLRRVLVRDPDGVILTYRRGHGFSVNPVATTGRWQGLNDAYPAERLADALLDMAVPRTALGRRFLSWEYFDVLDRPGEIQPGVSGMAQARLADLLGNAYERTGDPRYAEGARQALVALTVPVDEGGARSTVAADGLDPGPWYVERAYPGEDPWKGAALNGFMVALLSLRAVQSSLETGDDSHAAAIGIAPGRAGADLASSLAADGVRTLRRYLPLHDSGAWSFYGLLTPGRPWRTYLADLNYHCYHVLLLRRLHRLHPGAGFEEVADRWERYVADAGKECADRPTPGRRAAPPADPGAVAAAGG